VARTKGRCQEICTRMLSIPTEQSLTSKEDRRTTSIGNSEENIARDQY